MLKYILKRLLNFIPIIIGVSFLLFVMLANMNGDPVRLMAGENATPEQIESMREELGLNDPLLVRYFNYMVGVLQGDFGTSYRTKLPISYELGYRIVNTLKLASVSIIVAAILGVTFGIISAVKQYSVLDNICNIIGLFGISAPTFWVALILVIIFSVKLHILPATGLDNPLCYIMPCFCLGLQNGAQIMRFTRTAMLDVIRQDYIQTARAIGEPESKVVLKHALRNALVQIITAIGLAIVTLFTGSVLIETTFSISGIGKYVVDSFSYLDQPAVTGAIMVLSIGTALINLVIDVICAFVDPRILSRYSKKKVKANGKEQG